MARSPRDFIARFLSDTSKFDTSEASKDLDELGDDATTAAREVDKFGDDVDKTAKQLDDAFDRIRASSKRGMDDVGKNVDDGGSRIKEAGSEVGSEFAENIGEGMRSGDYTAVGFETATSLTSALGPVGLGIGLGAAIVGGLVSGAKQRAQDLRDATQEWVQIYKDAGALIVDEQTINDAAIDKLTGDQAAKYKQAAEEIGVSAGTLARALSGDAEAVRDVEAALGPANVALQESADKLTAADRWGGAVADKNRDLAETIGFVTEQLDLQATASDNAYEAMLRVHGATETEIRLLGDMKTALEEGNEVLALSFELQAEKENQRANATTAKRAVP